MISFLILSMFSAVPYPKSADSAWVPFGPEIGIGYISERKPGIDFPIGLAIQISRFTATIGGDIAIVGETHASSNGYTTDAKGNCHDNSNGRFSSKDNCSESSKYQYAGGGILEASYLIWDHFETGIGARLSTESAVYLHSDLVFGGTHFRTNIGSNFWGMILSYRFNRPELN